MTLLRRVVDFFVAPARDAAVSPRADAGHSPPPQLARTPPSPLAAWAPPAPAGAPAATGAPTVAGAPAVAGGTEVAGFETDPAPVRPVRAVVLGAPGHVVPVAAACAGELRARHAAAAALVCVWRPDGRPGEEEAARPPAGATTPGARRVAAALEADGLRATACGRLAWLALPLAPADALGELRRGLALADVPVVIAVAGARPAAFEPLLAVADLGLAVLEAGADPALRALAEAGLPGRRRHLLAPLAPGPARWSAVAGLARLRTLPGDNP